MEIKNVTYPFSVRASRKRRKNSNVLNLIKGAEQEHIRKDLEDQTVPGENLRPVTDTPYITAQLGDLLGIYEECMAKQAKISLAIHDLMLKTTRDKWVDIGAIALSERIRDRINEIFVRLGHDNGLRQQVDKSTYPLPKILLRNYNIDSEKAFAKFGLAVQKEIHEILMKATRHPPPFSSVVNPQGNLQGNPQGNPQGPDTTPTGTKPNGRVQPRKVGFTDLIYDTDINHHLSALAVDTGTMGPTG